MVLDEQGEPIIGANIVEKGTTKMVRLPILTVITL